MATDRRRVVWTRGARDDLDEAIDFISKESPSAALAVLERMLEAAQSLEELAERGRVLPELEDPVIRELLPNPFRLVYRVGADTIELLGVIHQRRDFSLWDRSEPEP